VFVVSNGQGYVVSARRPEDWLRLETLPIRGVRRIPAKPYVLMWDFQNLDLYGPAGLVWSLEDLSTDDLEITGVTSETITGRAKDPLKERMVDFAVDVGTGRVSGGWGKPTLHVGNG
jgi:hypothetical protein